MNAGAGTGLRPPERRERGYLLVLFVIAVAFVGIAAAMQVVVLTSVATTSRAYDSYRQGAAESVRLRRAVEEAILDVRQIAVPAGEPALPDALAARLSQLGGATGISVTGAPATLPRVATFPDPGGAPDPLAPSADSVRTWLTPELALLAGPTCAAYPELHFDFTSRRMVLDSTRCYATQVRVRMLAVPLTRFPVCAYELPLDIAAPAPAGTGPVAVNPGGLVPGRDPAFVADTQASAGALPYGYRQRAALAAAYQYVFSAAFVQRVTEHAGVTHFRQLDAGGPTAELEGLSRAGAITTWDLGVAGQGSFGGITIMRDAAVLFTESGGTVLRLSDSVGTADSAPLMLLVLGPSDVAKGALTVDLSPVARPVVLIGCNVHVTAGAGVRFSGALFLDPASSAAVAEPLAVGHLSYWAGSTRIPQASVIATALPAAAAVIAPRVVYVISKAARL